MAVHQVSDNGPDGAVLGNTAADKVALFGATPVVQQTAASALAGDSDSTAVANAVNAINTALTNLGVVA